jgi:hypothetical protein
VISAFLPAVDKEPCERDWAAIVPSFVQAEVPGGVDHIIRGETSPALP